MRASATTFFYRGTGNVVIDQDDLILNCYRLANYYHQNPEVFTEMSLSRLDTHIYYTGRLIALRESARRQQEENG
jgi:hypothetical protein